MEIVYEEWRPVVGSEGQYEVSNLGRVRSLPRSFVSKSGKQMTIPGKALSGKSRCHSGNGYLRANVGANRIRSVHSLVLEAFVGPRPRGCQACHCNGIKTDNRLVNLRWDTARANQLDRENHGTSPRGERCATSKLTEQQAIEVLDSSDRASDLAKRFGVSRTAIWDIRAGNTWAHLRSIRGVA